MTRSLGFFLLLVALGSAGFWLLTSPALQTPWLTSVPTGDPDLANGRNLFFAGNCGSCHATPNQESPFRLGGGSTIQSRVGIFYASNISPHPEYGIGSWTLQQFIRALRAGVSPDGRHYYPAFPYTSFQRMSVSDIRDLFSFMQTLPPIAGLLAGRPDLNQRLSATPQEGAGGPCAT
jgi:mono/diheme cytochrome c family protein